MLFSEAMETHASPHHLTGISRIHGDPRRMPDVDYPDKTSASILANPRMEQTKGTSPGKMASMMAIFGLA